MFLKIILGVVKFKFLVLFYLLLLFVVWNLLFKVFFDGVNIGLVYDIIKLKNEVMGVYIIF